MPSSEGAVGDLSELLATSSRNADEGIELVDEDSVGSQRNGPDLSRTMGPRRGLDALLTQDDIARHEEDPLDALGVDRHDCTKYLNRFIDTASLLEPAQIHRTPSNGDPMKKLRMSTLAVLVPMRFEI